MSEKEKCRVCKVNDAVGTYSSQCCPMSIPYCQECIDNDREPYSMLVTYARVTGRHPDDFHNWMKPTLESTLKFFNKTKDDLIEDAKKLQLKRDKDGTIEIIM